MSESERAPIQKPLDVDIFQLKLKNLVIMAQRSTKWRAQGILSRSTTTYGVRNGVEDPIKGGRGRLLAIHDSYVIVGVFILRVREVWAWG